MPRIAFWNLKDTCPVGTLVAFVANNAVDILVTAEEGRFTPQEFILAYRRTGGTLHRLGVALSDIRFYSTLPIGAFRPVKDRPYLSIKEYVPQDAPSLLIAGVHLPSRYSRKEDNQWPAARRVATEIIESERRRRHDRTIVLGDFNMDPFNHGMVSSDAFHGVMDRRVAARGTRRVDGQEYPYFYNPMWRLMGDGSGGAPGTYYLGSDGDVSYFWHTLDQVLVRPSLLARFSEESLRIITVVGVNSLLSDQGHRIDRTVSDHLPILFTIE